MCALGLGFPRQGNCQLHAETQCFIILSVFFIAHPKAKDLNALFDQITHLYDGMHCL